MILKIIMAIVVPISIILVLSLIMNSVFILIQLPQSVDRGQRLSRSLHNETVSIEYSYNKIISKLMIPALRDLFVAQELLSQSYTQTRLFDSEFQFYNTNDESDELISHLSSYRLIIKANIIVTCENGVTGVYGQEKISDFYVNCTSKKCINLDDYSSYWIKPAIIGDELHFSLIVMILNNRCLITERQPLSDFLDFVKSWDPSNIYRGLIVDSVLYQVNAQDEYQQGNLTALSRTYVNETEAWINNVYDQLNDCGYQFKTFEYEGENLENFLCRTTLIFIQNPLLQCVSANLTTKINFSILFLETFTAEHNNISVGQLNTSLEVNRFITVLFFLQFILFLYTWRQAVKISLSFVIPVRIMIQKILEQSVDDLSKQNFQNYDEYKNSKNVGEFIEAAVDYANSVKYQSNHFEMNAEGLMMISNSKKFFKKQNNLSAVGLCSNNIARIHAINKRYLEALNEQEESIQIAEQELQSLQQLDELHQKLSISRNWFQVYQSFKSKLLSKFVGEDRILERLQSQNFQPQLSKMISMEFKQRSNTMQIKRSSNGSSTDRARQHNQLITQNLNITSIALLQQIEKSNQSIQNNNEPVLDGDCRNAVKVKLLNRQYQLLQILGQFSNQHDQLFLNEILQLLLQMKHDTEDSQITSSFILELNFNICCQLVYYYTKSNQIRKAKTLLKNLPNRQQHRQNITQSINIFNQTPSLLLQSKQTLLRAIIDLKTNKIKQCCQKLISIMSTSIFDPIHYAYSYNLLHQIFEQNQLNLKLLEELQLTNQQIHALILIDYTNQMTEEQIKQSHSISKYILQLFTQQDEVGLYAFNSTFHQIFPLQNYKPYLQNCLNQLLLPPGGESCLFNLLQNAAGSFFAKNKYRQKEDLGGSYKSNNSISNDRSMQYSLSNAGDVLDKYLQTDFHDKIEDEQDVKSQLRIIILFAEMVKDYSQSNKEILRQIMNKRKIHIIVVHIANQNLNRIYLESFKDITSQSCVLKPSEVPKYFEQIRPAPFIKRQYIEFF